VLETYLFRFTASNQVVWYLVLLLRKQFY